MGTSGAGACGCSVLAMQLTAHFDAVRREIMTLPREGKTLQTEVREMAQNARSSRQ